MRALRRHHRDRVIANRVGFFRNVLRQEPWTVPGRFAKRKAIDCSCWTCSGHAKRRLHRAADKRAAVRQIAEGVA